MVGILMRDKHKKQRKYYHPGRSCGTGEGSELIERGESRTWRNDPPGSDASVFWKNNP